MRQWWARLKCRLGWHFEATVLEEQPYLVCITCMERLGWAVPKTTDSA